LTGRVALFLLLATQRGPLQLALLAGERAYLARVGLVVGLVGLLLGA
jgi:hypothetical protein